MKISKQKGTKDIFFEEVNIWQYIESKIREIALAYNLNEIRTPVFEATELFARGVGDETDIVNKEMYTFLDKGGRSITLRPELTAGVVRSYIENGFDSMPTPVKLWYTGNMYRYEKMQKGRYREFSQFGVEIFGSNSYLADVETILISYNLFKKLNLEDKISLNINSIGCSTCRKEYIQKLKEFVKPNLDKMCDTCKIRYEKNPLRMLDCKEEKCKIILKDAPMITDNLCEECNRDFENLKLALNNANIPYKVDKKIVRGLDYYNKTVYEYISKDLDLAVGGGGRYDTLVENLGGAHTPAVGFGLGMDRIEILLKQYNLCSNIKENIDVYFIVLINTAFEKLYEIINELRNLDYVIDYDIVGKSFNSQMKYANKQNAKYVCIIGEEEYNNNMCILKNMETGIQEKLVLSSNSIKEKIFK